MKTRSMIFLLFGMALFCLGLTDTLDPDLWWHLKTGELILKHGVPHTDIFSFTAFGRPWIVQEWLSEVIMGLVYGAGGLPGLMIGFALLSVLTFGLVYLSCPGRPLLAASLTFLGCWAIQFVWRPRPQLFNIMMLSVYLWLLRSVRNKKISWKWLYVLPFLACFWANLHSGHVMGLFVIAIILAGDAFQVWGLCSVEEGVLEPVWIKHLAFILFLSVLGSSANPEGFKIFLFPFNTLGDSQIQTNINEWLSHDFHNPLSWGFLAVLILGAVSFILTPLRVSLSDRLLYVGAMAAGLYSRRHSPFFIIIAIPLIARAFWSSLTSRRWQEYFTARFSFDRFWQVRYLLNTVVVVLALAGVCFWSVQKIEKNNILIPKTYPVDAVKFLKEKGFAGKRLFNDYAWGGYVLWNDVPVFIDGRTELYGRAIFGEYLTAYNIRRGLPWLQDFLERRHIESVLVNTGSRFARVLRWNRGWQEVYRGGPASVFLRKTVATA